MLWGQFINNSVTHNAYMYYYMYAQTLRFASVVCGAVTSSLHSKVTFYRVFWLEPVAPGSRVGAQTTGYFNWSRVGPQNRVFCRSWLWEPPLGIGYLKVSVPQPTLAGARFFKRVEPRFRFSIWNRVPGNRGTAGTAQAYSEHSDWKLLAHLCIVWGIFSVTELI